MATAPESPTMLASRTPPSSPSPGTGNAIADFLGFRNRVHGPMAGGYVGDAQIIETLE